jgi:hypothetical protein
VEEERLGRAGGGYENVRAISMVNIEAHRRL